MPAAQLEIADLSAGYGQTRVLENVSFAVPAGSRLAVLGRNGVGKTTLFATIAGQTRRYGGTIRLDGKELGPLESASRARSGLGYVPQARCVFASLTVEENLLVGLKDRPRTAIAEAYEMFPRLKERRKNLGSQLSGGEQQMLSTARTILGKPSVLPLDEPTQGLSVEETAQAVDTLARFLQASKMTVLLVEHDMEVVFRLAHRITVLHRGAVIADGAPEQVKADPVVQDAYLGGFA
jgi:branched-chain amino acid transport system ATP-binding protein